MKEYVFATALLFLALSPEHGKKHERRAVMATKVPELTWFGEYRYHFECPKGMIVYWPEINVLTDVPVEPSCITITKEMIPPERGDK